MSFFWPHAFWLLAIPSLLLWIDLTRRRRSPRSVHPKIVRAEADRRGLMLASSAAPMRPGHRARWRLALGLALAVVAFARPQWGRIEEPVFDQAREIIIAVDLSRSMLAEDVRPSRLARTKLLITSLLERLEGERVGLIVFAGTSFLQSPLSSDYEILREFLPALGPDYLPEGGTDFKGLLETALNAFASTSTADRYLIVLSDGEAQTDDWKAVIPRLVERGIRIVSLGVGTEAGSMIPDGEGSFVKDERGAVVLTRLQSSTLQELAQGTQGIYMDASQWVDLVALLRQTVEAGRAGEFTESGRARLAERFQWFLAPAFLLLWWSYLREFPVHPRARSVPLQTVATSPKRSLAATTASALLFLLTLGLLGSPQAGAAQMPPRPDVDALAAPLSSLVGQLAGRDVLGARDYTDLAQTTLTYGQRLKEAGQPVPSGPIRDGLEAVRAGQALDEKAADWPALRRDLEALLDQPEQPPQQPPQDQQQNDQNEKNGENSQDGSEKGENEKDSSDNSESESGPQQAPGEEGREGESTTPPPQAGQSAFGERDDPPPPPPPPSGGDTQQIGGQQEKRNEAAENPELTIPLQKLEQLRNQDSPARLHQLMQDPQGRPATKGRDW